MYPVEYLCIQYAKPWPYSDIRSCCCRSLQAFFPGIILLYLANQITTRTKLLNTKYEFYGFSGDLIETIN